MRLAGADRGHAGGDVRRRDAGRAPGVAASFVVLRADRGVLWFSDLRGFMRITEEAPPEQVIPLLNHTRRRLPPRFTSGGDVLKLIGDGTLAIFKADDPARACRNALEAEALIRERVQALNGRRAAEGLAGDAALPRAVHRRGVLWQHREPGPAPPHGGRPGGERGEPDRRDVPLGGAGRSSPRRSPRPPARRIASLRIGGPIVFRGVGGAQELFTLERRSVASFAAGEPSGRAAQIRTTRGRRICNGGAGRAVSASAIGRKCSARHSPARV